MKYIPLALVLLFSVTAVSWADSSDDDWDENPYCREICDMVFDCETPCQSGICWSNCTKGALKNKEDCLEAYENSCSDFSDCVCETGEYAEDDDDDSGCGGCDIAGAGAGAALSSVMMAIGLAALVISRRGRRS